VQTGGGGTYTTVGQPAVVYDDIDLYWTNTQNQTNAQKTTTNAEPAVYASLDRIYNAYDPQRFTDYINSKSNNGLLDANTFNAWAKSRGHESIVPFYPEDEIAIKAYNDNRQNKTSGSFIPASVMQTIPVQDQLSADVYGQVRRIAQLPNEQQRLNEVVKLAGTGRYRDEEIANMLYALNLR
jgi:hypothetical protein